MKYLNLNPYFIIAYFIVILTLGWWAFIALVIFEMGIRNPKN